MAPADATNPRIYVIAGPNGAGKTTFAREFLPLYVDCKKFINADLIAQGISPFSPETEAFRAGRLMLEEVELCSSRKESFGFETTLSGLAYVTLFNQLKKSGYEVHFFFLCLPAVSLALRRVLARVVKGGHDVPETVVRRRFDRSHRNFLFRYRQQGDSWMLFDNSGTAPVLVATEKEGRTRIIDQAFYEALMRRYGAQ